MTSAEVVVERTGAVVQVMLNRPDKRNALNERLIHRLTMVLDELGAEPSCRAIVLCGAGRSFCAGGDMEANIDPEPDAARAEDRHRAFLAAATRLRDLPKPTVAAVQGAAVGAGASLALLCDEIVVEPETRFGFGFLRVGLPPDLFCAATLQRRVGWTRAADLLHSGRLVLGPEAVQMGLATHLSSGPAQESAMERAADLAALSPYAFGATKAILRAAWNGDAGGQSDLEAALVAVATTTPEFRAATAKFRS
jgi:enoyl-CoA hydratase/carnithine racemase